MKKDDIPNCGTLIDQELQAFFYDYTKDGDLLNFRLIFKEETIVISRDGDSFKIAKYSS